MSPALLPTSYPGPTTTTKTLTTYNCYFVVMTLNGSHQLTGALAVVVEAHALVLREQQTFSGTLVHKQHSRFLRQQVLGHYETAFPEVCEVILQSFVAIGVSTSCSLQRNLLISVLRALPS